MKLYQIEYRIESLIISPIQTRVSQCLLPGNKSRRKDVTSEQRAI